MNRRDFLKYSSTAASLPILSSCIPWGPVSSLNGHKNKGTNKTLILLTMSGGPSQFESFSNKPELSKYSGKDVRLNPSRSANGMRLGTLKAPIYKMNQYGDSGSWVSDIFPHLKSHVDDLCFIHSCTSPTSDHGPAMLYMNTGSTLSGSPFLGSWIESYLPENSYGIPNSYVLLGNSSPKNSWRNWMSRYLEHTSTPVIVKDLKTPIPYLSEFSKNSTEDFSDQLKMLDVIGSIKNNDFFKDRKFAFEKAFETKNKLSSLFKSKEESERNKKLYGLENKHTKDFGSRLLMARRLMEKNVNFIQIYHGRVDNSDNWDSHENIFTQSKLAEEVDLPISGFISDLKQRGLWNNVIIVWGGEFGRTPYSDVLAYDSGLGRDHHRDGFTIWMAGGGIKNGLHYGSTDEIGLSVTDKPVTYNDVFATSLKLMGISHRQLKKSVNGKILSFTHGTSRIINEILS